MTLFLGEGARFVQTGASSLVFSGGFMGNQFNFKLGVFRLSDLVLEEEEMNIGYSHLIDVSQHAAVARMGHLIFWDAEKEQILIFGGQKAGRKMQKQTQRTMLNDIAIFDWASKACVDHVQFTEQSVPSRIYAVGFKIDHYVYTYGGLGNNGQLLDELTEMDMPRKLA